METAKTQPLPLRAEGGEPTLRTAPGVGTTKPPSSPPERRLLMRVGAGLGVATLTGLALVARLWATPEQAEPVDDSAGAAAMAISTQTAQPTIEAPQADPVVAAGTSAAATSAAPARPIASGTSPATQREGPALPVKPLPNEPTDSPATTPRPSPPTVKRPTLGPLTDRDLERR